MATVDLTKLKKRNSVELTPLSENQLGEVDYEIVVVEEIGPSDPTEEQGTHSAPPVTVTGHTESTETESVRARPDLSASGTGDEGPKTLDTTSRARGCAALDEQVVNRESGSAEGIGLVDDHGEIPEVEVRSKFGHRTEVNDTDSETSAELDLGERAQLADVTRSTERYPLIDHGTCASVLVRMI